MNGSVLDTNVITKLLDKDPAAIALVQKIENYFTSSIVVGELYYAAANSSKQEANFRNFREALSCMTIIPIDDYVCMAYAETKIPKSKLLGIFVGEEIYYTGGVCTPPSNQDKPKEDRQAYSRK